MKGQLFLLVLFQKCKERSKMLSDYDCLKIHLISTDNVLPLENA